MKRIIITILALFSLLPALNAEDDPALIRTFSGHSFSVRSVAFSPDGCYALSGSEDKTLKLWDVNRGNCLRTFIGHSDYVRSVAFSPDGRYALSGSEDQTLKLWDINSGTQIRTFRGYSDAVMSVAFSPDGRYALSGNYDKTLKLWDINSGTEIRTFRGHSVWVSSVAFSPDGRYALSGSYDNTLKLWDINSGEEIRAFSGHSDNLCSVAFSPDGRYALSGSCDKTLKLWVINSGEEIRTFRGHIDFIRSVAFSPDGCYALSGSSDHTLKLWDINSGNCLRTFSGHSSVVYSVAFSPDGRYALSGSFDNTLKLWDTSAFTGGIAAAPKPKLPPELYLIDGSIAFREPSGNQKLDALEKGEISVIIGNRGQGEAYNLKAELKSSAFIKGLELKQPGICSQLQPNSSYTFKFELRGGMELAEGQADFKITVSEGNGFDLETPINISIPLRAFQPPKLAVVDYGIKDNSGNLRIEKRELVDITARIQNQGAGEAQGVKVRVKPGDNVFFAGESKSEFELGVIPSGEYRDVAFTIYTNNQAEGVPLELSLSEYYGKYGATSKKEFALNQTQKSSVEFVVKGKEEQVTIPAAPELTVDIEKDIPVNPVKNRNAVALIIAISDYANPGVAKVDYAKRDAALMREYLTKALGYSPENILPHDDGELMTFAVMRTYVRSKLPSFLKPDGSSDLFVYYAGHGAPSGTMQEAFFVPYDCDPNFVSPDNAYGMQEFYRDIAQLKAKKKIVVVDACFSGSTGGGGTLVRGASPISLKVDNIFLNAPESILFQSSASDQVSNWYPEKQHSMFTYFFLKGLQGSADLNRDGMITAGELERFINDGNEGLPYYSNRVWQRPQSAVIIGDKNQAVLKLK